MAKKRKFSVISSKIPCSTPTEVIIEDLSTHPLCLHGPTLLFSNKKGRYFGCSLCRDKTVCSIHIDEEDWQKEGNKIRNKKYYELISKLDKGMAWKNFCEVKAQHASHRAYCNTCQELFLLPQSRKHTKDHRITTPLADEQLAFPSSWLPTLENDSREAQYIFTKNSVSTILGILKNNSIKNIICIGTPSVHEAAQAHPEFDSILLDYDVRHHLFHSPNKFLWYNMFNNYFFADNDEKILRKFIKKTRDGGICVLIDPPFGGRVEPLVHTLKELSSIYTKIYEKADETIPVIWAFPYFAEPYIKNAMPEMKMHDYQVQYENHKKFHNKNGRKFGSPVRFFTNLQLATIDLSNDNNYKFCDKCKYWVSTSNRHCNKCKECSSKNGMTYRHCNICKRCVKPTFMHCEKCGRCCQQKGHVCGTVVESQSCFNCREKGHKKADCPQLQIHEKKKIKHG